MFIAAVMIANLFMGINTHVWTVWVFGSVALGIAMIWMFFVSVFHSSETQCLDYGHRAFITPSLHPIRSRFFGETTTSSSHHRTSGSPSRLLSFLLSLRDYSERPSRHAGSLTTSTSCATSVRPTRIAHLCFKRRHCAQVLHRASSLLTPVSLPPVASRTMGACLAHARLGDATMDLTSLKKSMAWLSAACRLISLRGMYRLRARRSRRRYPCGKREVRCSRA